MKALPPTSASSLNGMQPRLNRRAGQMLVFVTLSLIFMFGVMGLSVDLGYSYFVKVQTQAAAVAAAAAAAAYASANGSTCGSGGVVCGTSYSCVASPTPPATTAMQAGCLYAKANGFVNSGNQTVALIENTTTPPNETGNAPNFWVQATVTQTVPHLFLFLSGFKSGSVASEAIAGITLIPSASCVYILDPTMAGALTISGSGSVTASGCGVWVNSSSTTAVNMSGSAILTATGGGTIKVHASSNTGVCAYSCTVSPALTLGAATVADPFASLPSPTVGTTCTYTNYTSPTTGSGSIGPGVYCGGINVGNSYSLTMTSGMYIMYGGGFNVAGSASVTGSGVTVFLTGGTLGGHTYTSSGVQLTNGGSTTLSAPTSGTYQGVLFFQDRLVTYTTGNAIAGAASTAMTGTFYFPTTSLSLSGSISAAKVALVVDSLSDTGSATYDQDSTGQYTGLAHGSTGLIQ